MSDSDTVRRIVRLKIQQGLHIRACSNVLSIVTGFPGTVSISYGEKKADASSMFDLMLLAAVPDSELLIEANGNGANDIVDRIEKLFSIESEQNH